MHIHEYECKKCLHKFMFAHPAGEHDKHRVVKCPKCSSTHVKLCFDPLYKADAGTEPFSAAKEEE